MDLPLSMIMLPGNYCSRKVNRMLTPVFLITTDGGNTKVECGNEKVEGTVKTPYLRDRHRHSLTTNCKSITRTEVFARPLSRIIG